jgi:hypothetical protein
MRGPIEKSAEETPSYCSTARRLAGGKCFCRAAAAVGELASIAKSLSWASKACPYGLAEAKEGEKPSGLHIVRRICADRSADPPTLPHYKCVCHADGHDADLPSKAFTDIAASAGLTTTPLGSAISRTQCNMQLRIDLDYCRCHDRGRLERLS